MTLGRDSDKNKLRTFEPRDAENFKNMERHRKKSGSYKKSVYDITNEHLANLNESIERGSSPQKNMLLAPYHQNLVGPIHDGETWHTHLLCSLWGHSKNT